MRSRFSPELVCERNLDIDDRDLSSYEAHIQRKRASDHYQRAKKYWFDRLPLLPSGPVLPLASSLSTPRRSQLVRRKHVLTASQWEIITKQAQTQHISSTTLLLTAFSLIVAYWSKNQHFSLTMMVQNRDRDFENLYGVVGNFASTVLIEADFRKSQSFEQYALEIHRQVFRDIAHSRVCGLDILEERNRQDRSAFHAASPVAFVSMLSESNEQVAPGIFQLEGDNVVFTGLETPQVLLDHQAISRPDNGVSLIWDTMDSAFEDKAEFEQSAVSFFSKRFGINLDDPKYAGRVIMVPFMVDPRWEYRVYTSSGDRDIRWRRNICWCWHRPHGFYSFSCCGSLPKIMAN